MVCEKWQGRGRKGREGTRLRWVERAKEEEEVDMKAEERNKWKGEYEEGKAENKGIGASRMTKHK